MRKAARNKARHKLKVGFFRRKPKEAHYKVAIIGAGMAGLAAAKTLHKFGHRDFIILEAQNRAGGRIHTINYEDNILELGAQFLHGKDNPLYQLALQHGLVAEDTTEEGIGVYIRENGDVVDDFLVKRVDFEIGKILGECEKFVDCADYPSSVGDFMERKFADYLNKCGDCGHVEKIKWELFDWHRRFQVIDNATMKLSKLSAKGWGQYSCMEDKAHVNLKCGYGQLVDILVDTLPKNTLSLSTPVSAIQHGTKYSDPVELICENGSRISCDHLIIAVSLGVLKRHLRFSPPLPCEITQAIDDVGFDGIGKVFLIFEHKWWDVAGFQLLWNTDTVLSDSDSWVRDITGFDSVLNAPNVLLGWVGGKGLATMEGLSEEQVGFDCIKLLRKFITNRRIPDPIKVIRTRWLSNPWIRGAYSHITPDCDRSGSGMQKLSEPVFVGGKLRILIAGEAVHASHYSTTHGAYESGQQQAELLTSYIANCSKL